MEKFPVGWLAEFETNNEDPVLIHRMDSLDNLTPQQMVALFEVDFRKSEILSSYPTISNSSDSNKINLFTETCDVRPTRKLESTTTDSTTEHTSSPEAFSFQNVFHFGNSVDSVKSKVEAVPSQKKRFTSDSRISKGSYVNANCVPKSGSEGEKTSKPNSCTDHVIAERKRREKLAQQFVALSAIIPGLTRITFL